MASKDSRSDRDGELAQPPYDVDKIRAAEYQHMDVGTFLDHTGATVYSKSLLMDFARDMISNLYGNPHSTSDPSALASRRMEVIRKRTLRFFNADPEKYMLIFTSNATAAIKLVWESLRDYTRSHAVWYGYHKDSHNSIVGVREMVRVHRCFISDAEVDSWIDDTDFSNNLPEGADGLFASPAQSNMTGRRLPLDWTGRIRRRRGGFRIFTLLDAAAYVSTAPLDLSDFDTAPDFIPISFYKIFGFPNIGALIVRRYEETLNLLSSRKHFAGGTIDGVTVVDEPWHAMAHQSNSRRYEEGTVPFTSIFALEHAISLHEKLYGSMANISMHTSALIKQMYDQLIMLRHANGTPVIHVYKDDHTVFGDSKLQGSCIAFNVLRPNGSMVSWSEVEGAANERSIFLRSGGLCNPLYRGGVATYLNWSSAEYRRAYEVDGQSCENPIPVLRGKPTGVVRASVGAMTTSAQIDRLARFISDVYVDRKIELATQPAVARDYAESFASIPALTDAATMNSMSDDALDRDQLQPPPWTLRQPTAPNPKHKQANCLPWNAAHWRESQSITARMVGQELESSVEDELAVVQTASSLDTLPPRSKQKRKKGIFTKLFRPRVQHDPSKTES